MLEGLRAGTTGNVPIVSDYPPLGILGEREKSFPSRLPAVRHPFIRCPTVRGGSRPIRRYLFRSSFEFIPLHNPSNAISSRILIVAFCNDLRLKRTRMNYATPRLVEVLTGTYFPSRKLVCWKCGKLRCCLQIRKPSQDAPCLNSS